MHPVYVQRMKLYTSGLKVHKLGSAEDIVVRQYLVKQSEKEVAKTKLMAMLVSNSIPFSDEAAGREWASKIRTIFTAIMGFEYGVEIPEFSDSETKMISHYNNKIKHLKPKLVPDGKGSFKVTGLSSLKD